MMSYRSRDNKKTLKVFLLVISLIAMFFYSGIVGSLHNFFRFLLYPIWINEKVIINNTINPSEFFVPKKTIIIENQLLRKKLEETEASVADKILLLKENIELKEILGREVGERNLVLASVLSKPNRSLYDSLIVDLGRDSGIKKNDSVYVYGNILIGVVDEVYEKTSKIKLYSSPNEKLDVLVGFNNISAVATGRGSGNFIIKVPRDTDIEVGEPVAVTGLNSPILGSIEEVSINPVDSFKFLLFKSPVNIFELKWVQISKTE